MPTATKKRMATTLVLTDPQMDMSGSMMRAYEGREPFYTVGNVARFWFGRGAHWLRLAERDGYFTLDGQPIKLSQTEAGARIFTLADIERVAHALAQNGRIDGQRLHNALRMCQLQAAINGQKTSRS